MVSEVTEMNKLPLTQPSSWHQGILMGRSDYGNGGNLSVGKIP